MQMAVREVSFAAEREANNKDARIAMIAITTSNSMRVNPARENPHTLTIERERPFASGGVGSWSIMLLKHKSSGRARNMPFRRTWNLWVNRFEQNICANVAAA